MKRYLLPLLFLAFGWNAAADDAAERCVAALGGVDAWNSIRSLDVRCKHTSFGKTVPCRLRRLRPDFYRLDYSEIATPRTDAYDGDSAWWDTTIPLISRADWPVPAPSIYTTFFRRQAEFDWPMIDAETKGHAVRSLGETTFEGESFVGLEITRADGHGEQWYLDPESFVPLLRVDEGVYHGYPVTIRTHFSDYRKVAGVLMPFVVEYEQGNDYRIVEVESVDVNPAIDRVVFQRPLPDGMTTLRPLAGEWQVMIESRDDPAFSTELKRDWEEHRTAASIESRDGGALLAETLAIRTKRPRDVERLFSYDRFRKVFRVVRYDTYAQQLDVLEGELGEDGRIVVTNLGTGTPMLVGGQPIHVRETIFDITPDAFRSDRELSRDGGETWWTDLRLTYVRR